MTLNTLLLILVFLIGLYFYARCVDPNYKEGFNNNLESRCPNLLIQKDSKFYLYNSKQAQVPGVNPIEFENLEDYTEFLDWQRSQGIRCPVLYLQETYDASGKLVCKARPCTSEPQGGLAPSSSPTNATAFRDSLNDNMGEGVMGEGVMGEGVMDEGAGSESTLTIDSRYQNLKKRKLLDAGHDDPPFNRGHYPSYDPSPFYRGVHTPLDQLDVIEESKPVSANAMDPNWGGRDHTQGLIDTGFYKDNEVYTY